VSAATQFLDSYLPVLYGRGQIAMVTAVTGDLRRRWRSRPPTVSPGARRLRPVVQALTTYPQTPRSAQAVALIADGGTVNYPLSFDLRLKHGRWLVTALAD
jgi:hypothetical protein